MPSRWLPRQIGMAILSLAAPAAFENVLRADDGEAARLFRERVSPILERHCLSCHGGSKPKGGLSLETTANLLKGGESGDSVVPGQADDSLLVEYISGSQPEMPKGRPPLSAEEVASVRAWIESGAVWPDGLALEDKHVIDTHWWSLEPVVRHEVPVVESPWPKTPIDSFIYRKLAEQNLAPSPEADRRTLIRRLSFDLVGLPPTPAEVAALVADPDPQAYERLVDKLLESPQYGERWARHWLDVVHYGDTHGFDKDKLRPNAWPYRDYVIRAFNADKPYARFVEEQLAGDVLYGDTVDGIVALGFIAAGPFDWVGHIEVPESKMEGRASRNLDRDDMVRTAMETFASVTVGCARCHNHKFDPISQEDYYSLQAVFAAVDRAERPFDADPAVAARRTLLVRRGVELAGQVDELQREVAAAGGEELAAIDRALAELAAQGPAAERPEFGYHSLIEPRSEVTKWVQVDLGRSLSIDRIVYVACHDDFNGIGAGFGFPPRFKIEISDDADFAGDVAVVVDRTAADVPNPGVAPQSVDVGPKAARYVRVTATKLALRQNDYIFALGELAVLTPDGANVARGANVVSLDSIEAPVRWSTKNLVDGYYRGLGQASPADVARLQARRDAVAEMRVSAELRQRLAGAQAAFDHAQAELAAVPPPAKVFAAATHFPAEGGHVPSDGRPRQIAVLHRGDVKSPRQIVTPGALSCIRALPARFEEAASGDEGQRRAALAHWLAHRDNPLAWRSIVNRVWHYHFGRGIVDSPNDFGRMGSPPAHPELLDWLAAWFRDDAGGSMKKLHRLIVTSAAYRQSSVLDSAERGTGSAERNARAEVADARSALRAPRSALAIDADNRLLWRMNRRRLEAEALRDAVLATAGKLDPAMGGPGFFAFGFKDDHSPHYLYEDHDPDDPRSWRRSVYRFIVRSVPDPFLETLDCADPSQLVERRNETLTALQALALLNNRFMLRMSEHFAARVEAQAGAEATWQAKIDVAFQLAFQRGPSEAEIAALSDLAAQQGLASVCRVLFNANEYLFVD